VDNLTHTLFGLTLGRTPLGRAGRGTTAALLVSSNAPDIDIVTAAGGGVSYLHWHRGPTHGLLGIVGLGVLTAGLVWLWQRVRDRGADQSGRAPFGTLVSISIVGVLLHVLMDLPTSYGTRLLSPFDWHWFAVDWIPIVDVYLLAALAIGLLFGTVSEASRRRNAAIALALMAANYGLRAVAHHDALVLAPRVLGPLVPAKCAPEESAALIDAWPSRAVTGSGSPGTRCLVEIAAMPTLVSPFRWRVIVRLPNAYQIHEIDVLDARIRSTASPSAAPWRATTRIPNNWTPAVMQAAGSQLGRVFLGFSRFPSARALVDPAGTATVRFSDVRFAGGLLTLAQRPARPDPFTAVIRVGPDGQILDERLAP
jgi:membrane-bound metal-dependent hydrolase YbcI (DUF457 family)